TALGETPFATRYLAIAMGSLRSFRSTRGQGFACVRGAACAFSAGALVPGASSSVTLVMCPPRVCPTKDAKEGDRGRGFFRGAPRDGRRKGSPAHGLTRTRDAAMPERSPHVEPYDGALFAIGRYLGPETSANRPSRWWAMERMARMARRAVSAGSSRSMGERVSGDATNEEVTRRGAFSTLPS